MTTYSSAYEAEARLADAWRLALVDVDDRIFFIKLDQAAGRQSPAWSLKLYRERVRMVSEYAERLDALGAKYAWA